MKHCHACGKEIRNKGFCPSCGEKISKRNKLLYIFPALIFLALIIIIAYANYQDRKERLEESKRIVDIKDKQRALDEEFYNAQSQREKELENSKFQASNRDVDSDGLTYSQEVELGTDDNNPDSDGDDIKDNEDKHPAGGGEIIKKSINWQHNGLSYTTQFSIAEDKYLYYKTRPRNYCCEGWSEFATPQDQTIQTISKDIIDVSLSTNDPDKLSIAIDFVESMTYQYDIAFNNNPEYPKYAIETIIDERGDCEDTSFLMASILKSLGVDTILLLYSDHMAVGVACDTGCTGTYYIYKGKNYFFLETTGASGSWKIGGAWGKYLTEKPRIIDVN